MEQNTPEQNKPMSQPEEQKTAEEILTEVFERKTSIIPHSEVLFEMVIKAMEEYASQQTASLRKQHREESVQLLKNLRATFQIDIDSLRKQVQEKESLIASVRKKCVDAYTFELEATKASLAQMDEAWKESQKVIERLKAENEQLQKFKDYVHKRLDDMGIEKDPESPHKAAGCRIGGRLDIVEQLKKENERLIKSMDERVNSIHDLYAKEHEELELKAQPSDAWKETLTIIKGLYKKPFVYDNHGQMIFDANNEHVLDLRGWGRIQYLPDPETKQDTFGQYIADLLNANYE